MAGIEEIPFLKSACVFTKLKKPITGFNLEYFRCILDNNGFADYKIMQGLQTSFNKIAGYDKQSVSQIAASYINASPSWQKLFNLMAAPENKNLFLKSSSAGHFKGLVGTNGAIFEGFDYCTPARIFFKATTKCFLQYFIDLCFRVHSSALSKQNKVRHTYSTDQWWKNGSIYY